ncbi:MAG: hypothetical protein PPP58_03355 [Natronomonas sp.]
MTDDDSLDPDREAWDDPDGIWEERQQRSTTGEGTSDDSEGSSEFVDPGERSGIVDRNVTAIVSAFVIVWVGLGVVFLGALLSIHPLLLVGWMLVPFGVLLWATRTFGP